MPHYIGRIISVSRQPEDPWLVDTTADMTGNGAASDYSLVIDRVPNVTQVIRKQASRFSCHEYWDA